MKNYHQKVEMSFFMSFFYKLKFYKISWSLRRLYCPVKREMLVLEIGSGGNPYFRSNILIDSYYDTQERHWAPLVRDRPIVLGAGEFLPFKDNSFDFIIASHVLEHSSNPKKFIKEMQRVGKAGYIETPDAFMERINPYIDHRAEVYVKENTLIINKKNNWFIDKDLLYLYNRKAKNHIAKISIPSNPYIFHARYYWKELIKFKILNPFVDSNWKSPSLDTEFNASQNSFVAKLKKNILFLTRILFSQRKRNKKINIESILICPSCRGDKLLFGYRKIKCTSCNKIYIYEKGIPNMSINIDVNK